MSGLSYVTCCINSTAGAIQDMIDLERQVTYRTALKRIGRAELARTFPDYDWHRRGGLTMKRDWHVGYYRSRYLGRPCYFVRWSAIEFIFA
jgi:hypothetical protein